MRHLKKLVLTNALETKQSHHKGKKMKLKDTDMEKEEKGTNNKEQ